MLWQSIVDGSSVMVADDATRPDPLGLDLVAAGERDYSKFANAALNDQWSFLDAWWPNEPKLDRDAWPNEDSLLVVAEWH